MRYCTHPRFPPSRSKLAVVVHACSPSFWWWSQEDQGFKAQPWLFSEFGVCLGYLRFCVKQENKKPSFCSVSNLFFFPVILNPYSDTISQCHHNIALVFLLVLEVKPQASSKANMNWVLPAPCTFLSVFFPSLHLKLGATKLDPAPYKNRKSHAVHAPPWALHWGDCTVPLPLWHLHFPLYVVSASEALSAAKPSSLGFFLSLLVRCT